MTARIILALITLAVLPASSAQAQGGRIAFSSAQEGEPAVEILRSDGSGRGTVVPDASHPTWSPGGAMLAFSRLEDDETGGIWVAAADGSGQRRITHGQGEDAEPAWGPAPAAELLGPAAPARIAFTRLVRSENDATLSVWIVAEDGSDPRKVSGDLFAHAPAWSPDGRQIAFSTIRLEEDGFAGDIHVVDADGGAPRMLIADASSPAWSPDGTRIAFTSTRDRNGENCLADCSPASEVYVAEASGAAPTRLTFDPAEDRDPAWSAVGSSIVFSSGRFYPAGESLELHAMRADGSCVVRLTAGAAWAGQPAWEPGTEGAPPCAQPGLDYAGIDLEPLRRYRRLPLLWLGQSFSGLVPSSANVPGGRDVPRLVDLSYGDCGRADGRCPAPVQLQFSSVCDSNPLSFSGVPGSRIVIRGALVERYGEATGIYTGGLSVLLHTGGSVRGPSRAALRRMVAALRPTSGPARLGRRLAPPVFPRTMLHHLRRAELTLRRHGIEEARRRLRLSRSAIRDRVRLARTLRSLPPPTARQRRAARCRPDPFLP